MSWFRSDPDLPLQARDLYADVGVRALAWFIDVFLCLALAFWVLGSWHDRGMAAGADGYLAPAALLLYWVGFVASPWQATPGKLLLGLRVVRRNGSRPRWPTALLRAILLLGTFGLVFGLVDNTSGSLRRALGFAGGVLLALAAVGPRRQAAHDLAAGTLVVRRRALRHPDARDLLADPDFVCGQGWKGRLSQAGDLAVLAAAMAVLWLAGYQNLERDRLARIRYAVDEARSVGPRLEAFHAEHGRFPAGAAELGLPDRSAFPDGGYWSLEAEGRIRIGFERLPDLAGHVITLTPAMSGGRLSWTCNSDSSEIARRLPPVCRS